MRRYVSSIATFHRAAGVANPCETQAVKLALKRMHRERGRAQAQAAPINDVLVARMLAATGDTLRHHRNRALLAVAYSTLCRRSELVALRYADCRLTPRASAPSSSAAARPTRKVLAMWRRSPPT